MLLCHARYPLFVHACTQVGVYIWMISIVKPGTVEDYLLIVGFVRQGWQRCRIEMPLDLTWARERILKIIGALGGKAKLSIFREFYFGRYCVRPSSHYNYQWELRFGYLICSIRLLAKLTHDIASPQICR